VVASPKAKATYADVLAAPAHVVAEVLFGVLYTHSRPAAPHTRASSRLGAELDGPFDRGRGGPGGWIILDEPELHFGKAPDEDIIVPDLAGWRRERMPSIADVAFFTLAPDWVCEVLSPSTAPIDRTEKMHIYAREGVRHAWLVDPIAKTLEVFRLARATPRAKAKSKGKTKRAPARARSGSGDWVLVDVWRGDAKVRAEPFDAVPLELGALWS
jgi:Uma2 family endonuclease